MPSPVSAVPVLPPTSPRACRRHRPARAPPRTSWSSIVWAISDLRTRFQDGAARLPRACPSRCASSVRLGRDKHATVRDDGRHLSHLERCREQFALPEGCLFEQRLRRPGPVAVGAGLAAVSRAKSRADRTRTGWRCRQPVHPNFTPRSAKTAFTEFCGVPEWIRANALGELLQEMGKPSTTISPGHSRLFRA